LSDEQIGGSVQVPSEDFKTSLRANTMGKIIEQKMLSQAVRFTDNQIEADVTMSATITAQENQSVYSNIYRYYSRNLNRYTSLNLEAQP
jgi:hypothetical protein